MPRRRMFELGSAGRRVGRSQKRRVGLLQGQSREGPDGRSASGVKLIWPHGQFAGRRVGWQAEGLVGRKVGRHLRFFILPVAGSIQQIEQGVTGAPGGRLAAGWWLAGGAGKLMS